MNILDALTRDYFNTLIRVRTAHDLSADAGIALHAQLRENIDHMMSRALAASMPRDDVYAIAFAMVALADMVGTRNKGGLGTLWREQRLHAHYFGSSTSPDTFFERLDEARRSGRRDVLHVYATCLALGYRGRLAAADADRVLEGLLPLLQPVAWSDGTSPILPQPRETRAWQPFWLPLAAMMLCVALYAIFSSSMHTDTAVFTSYVDALMQAR